MTGNKFLQIFMQINRNVPSGKKYNLSAKHRVFNNSLQCRMHNGQILITLQDVININYT